MRFKDLSPLASYNMECRPLLQVSQCDPTKVTNLCKILLLKKYLLLQKAYK